MTWDFAETNPFSTTQVETGYVRWSQCGQRSAAKLPAGEAGTVRPTGCAGASSRAARCRDHPPIRPYYDNISYADLSDFFFVWLRRNLSEVWPDECATLLTPKADELIANRYRAGSKSAARDALRVGNGGVHGRGRRSPGTCGSSDDLLRLQGDRDRRRRDPFNRLGHIPSGGTRRWPAGQRQRGRCAPSSKTVFWHRRAMRLASSIVLACRPRTGVSTA